MYLDTLAEVLLKIYEERSLTYESMAEMIGISSRHLWKLINRRATPSISTIEKICKAFDITPDELLIAKSRSFVVTIIKKYRNNNCYPICPKCKTPLEREYQSFCDRCGAELDWSRFDDATVIT